VADLTIRLKTLTPLWTGGVDQQCDRLHETGLLGSLRWWYEALVRGLGGSACDPTDNSPCRDDGHCAACELFGCTGWSRRFRLRVLDRDGQPIQDPLEKDLDFVLQFVELHRISDKETWLMWLMAKAVEIAARYGALGGKTTLKPQRNARGLEDTLKKLPRTKPGDDMGVLAWQMGPSLVASRLKIVESVKSYARTYSISELPDLRWFFFVSGSFLKRDQMNRLMGLSPDGRTIIRRGAVENALRGEIGKSKKLFSFSVGGGRIWGYASNRELRDKIIGEIGKELGKSDFTIRTGEEVLDEL
jgi:CRISPR-associated protein Cmr1